jgi:hypothetical protein
VSKTNGERQLSARRDTEHRRSFAGQGNFEAGPRPMADVPDEERWPSPANTIASGPSGGMYTVTCRPPS